MRAALLLALCQLACVKHSEVFLCNNDNACVLNGARGWCTPTGYCSWPDPTCDGSGLRYGSYVARQLAGSCVVGYQGWALPDLLGTPADLGEVDAAKAPHDAAAPDLAVPRDAAVPRDQALPCDQAVADPPDLAKQPGPADLASAPVVDMTPAPPDLAKKLPDLAAPTCGQLTQPCCSGSVCRTGFYCAAGICLGL